MKFMLLMNTPYASGDYEITTRWAPADYQAHVRFMQEFNRELTSAGQLVGVQGLTPPARARLVRSRPDGRPEITDGPFAEAKEFLAGYWIIDVESTDEACAIAAHASRAPGPGGAPLNMVIEVREVMFG